jgi:hypothetical protein
MRTDRLDPEFALFNPHVNKAGERAMKVLEEFFPPWAEEIHTFGDEEKLRILEEDPTFATAAYVALVTTFANE